MAKFGSIGANNSPLIRRPMDPLHGPLSTNEKIRNLPSGTKTTPPPSREQASLHALLNAYTHQVTFIIFSQQNNLNF